MSEIPVMIPAGNILLEALYDKGRPDGLEGVILCHPHPLYGGSMDNNVVAAMQNAFQSFGWATLRFNFRGVGRSGGKYGDGDAEAEDVKTAASYLSGQGKTRLHLTGYSFGAWVALKAVRLMVQPASMVLASPPIDFLEFGDLRLPPAPCLITLGDRDTFCTVESLQRWLSDTSPAAEYRDVAILPGCDHFYWGHERSLSIKISELVGKLNG